ncbi:MAG TPA: alkaline phosphatase [Baekduia sp.]|nr:alkaline phosphatase [Baekduia sp.]
MRAGTATALAAAAALALGAGVVAGAGGDDDAGRSLPPPAPQRQAVGPATSVIFLLGDGMGAGARALIRRATGERLQMDALPRRARVRTDPAEPDGAVTDSAAAATAFATGHKTSNGAVAVDPAGRPLPTILERAKAAGKATGLVTTSLLTDASPAAFAAHVADRREHEEIARQYLDRTRPDVLLGGGARAFGAGLLARAERLGYEVLHSAREMRASRGRRLLGLFASGPLFHAAPEPDGVYAPPVSLAAMTRKALTTLGRHRRGFFLLVEEEAIDELAHANNAELVAAAGVAFDAAVGAARAYARRHPSTLVVVGGDHETGGLSVVDGGRPAGPGEDGPFTRAAGGPPFLAAWTTTAHTARDVPFSASGPGAGAIAGTLDNTAIHDVLSAALLGRRRP